MFWLISPLIWVIAALATALDRGLRFLRGRVDERAESEGREA